jgi:NADP-dependent 3-hydroxy acid dehydrogenase YdfG
MMTRIVSHSGVFATEVQDVADKAIVISGGTTGIGRTTAILLAELGARVLIFGRHEVELNDSMRDLEKISDAVFGLTADVSRTEDVKRVFREADEKLGRVDVLINNAALSGDGVMDHTMEEAEYIIDTNVFGYVACAHEAIRRMKQVGGGHIINVGSMSAETRGEGSSVYTATKTAIQGFSESLRKEVNKYGIKVTLIEPGAVGTDMQPEPPEEQREKQAALEMLKAEDIAACIHYCLVQPHRCDVIGVQIQPHKQAT